MSDGLGLIARCDNGGLGNQTWELARHLQPERVLLMRMPGAAGRGTEYPERYADFDVTEAFYPLAPADLAAFAGGLFRGGRGLKTVLTSETWYANEAVIAVNALRSVGARSALIAMPELYVPAGEDLIIAPTTWHQPAGSVHLPHPVALDRFPNWKAPQEQCMDFYHPAAPAMLDRNGAELVLQALPYVEAECGLTVRSDSPPPSSLRLEEVEQGRWMGAVFAVTVEWLNGRSTDYWDQYVVDCDALLLPRRYAGMCLPAQESAALGWPRVMLDLPPQDEWPGSLLVPATVQQKVQMKGGRFPVHTAEVQKLADTMTYLASFPDVYQETSSDSRAWAESISWDALLPRWLEVLS